MKIQPYITFDGNCQQALNFYQDVFGGKIVNRETYANKDIDVPEHYRDKLQHAELKSNSFNLMGYDAAPDTPVTNGTTVSMSVNVNDKSEADKVFDKLSSKGKIHSPMQKSSWGEYYGRCSDEYGVTWMINCSNN